MVSRTRILIFAATGCILIPCRFACASQDANRFLSSLKAEARAAGVSPSTFDRAMDGFSPIPRIIELDRNQPEGRKTFSEYRKNLLSEKRIRQAREFMESEKTRLARVEKTYGVPASVIVSLWGIETNFGAFTGGFFVPHALATLAMDGRRADFFRKELIKALVILEQGHVSVENMKGSWAGAMGQVQFMPSSFEAFSVDGDGDGRRDIWGNRTDVFASAANYLARSGWKRGEPWGFAVNLPKTLDAAPLAGMDKTLPTRTWQAMGVVRQSGDTFQALPEEASLVMPDGQDGPAFLVFDNYRVFLKWNRSIYFATVVGILSGLAGDAP